MRQNKTTKAGRRNPTPKEAAQKVFKALKRVRHNGQWLERGQTVTSRVDLSKVWPKRFAKTGKEFVSNVDTKDVVNNEE